MPSNFTWAVMATVTVGYMIYKYFKGDDKDNRRDYRSYYDDYYYLDEYYLDYDDYRRNNRVSTYNAVPYSSGVRAYSSYNNGYYSGYGSTHQTDNDNKKPAANSSTNTTEPKPKRKRRRGRKHNKNKGVECTICLSNLQDGKRRLPCGHTFHLTCINRWFGQELSCPICRRSFY